MYKIRDQYGEEIFAHSSHEKLEELAAQLLMNPACNWSSLVIYQPDGRKFALIALEQNVRISRYEYPTDNE